MKRWWTVLTAALLLTACTDGTVFDRYAHTPHGGWDRAEALTFDVDSLPQDGLYGMELGLRADTDYPFMSITVIVDCEAWPSRTWWHDTLQCQLVDDKGNTLGRGISNYQYAFHIADRHWRQGDSLHIAVRHHMRREVLRGINDIGIKIDKK